jgi:hypothetical protein
MLLFSYLATLLFQIMPVGGAIIVCFRPKCALEMRLGGAVKKISIWSLSAVRFQYDSITVGRD